MEDDILQMFLEDTREHLADIETDLLDLEEAGPDFDPEIVNKVFRTAHSIKGSAGFLGLDNIRDLSHKIENVLDMVRSFELEPTPQVVNIVLKAFDKLEELVDNVDQSEQIDISGHVDTLTALVTGSLPQEEQIKVTTTRTLGFPGKPDIFTITEHDLAQARKGGNFIYIVEYDLIHDVHKKDKTPLDLMHFLEKSGLILDCKMDISAVGDLESEPSNRIPFYILYASILEPDLVKAIFQVEEKFIHHLDLEEAEAPSASEPAEPEPAPEPAPEPEAEPEAEPKIVATAEAAEQDVDDIERQFDEALKNLGAAGNSQLSATMDGAAADMIKKREGQAVPEQAPADAWAEEPVGAEAPVDAGAGEETVEGYTLRGQDGHGDVLLTGDLTIEQAQSLKAAMLRALERFTEVRVDLSGIEAADLAGLQVLWSAFLSGRNRGVAVVCDNVAEPVLDAARRAGFTQETAQVYGMQDLGLLQQ